MYYGKTCRACRRLAPAFMRLTQEPGVICADAEVVARHGMRKAAKAEVFPTFEIFTNGCSEPAKLEAPTEK